MNSQATERKKNLNLISIALVLINLCITIPLAFWLNIWADEAYSLMTSSKDLGYAIHQSLIFEVNAPLYFLLLNIWRQINDSIFFSRLLSAFCLSITIYLSISISKRYLPSTHPAWVPTFIAFHPFAIWAAVEIRLYALSILLSTLLLLLFHDAYLVSSSRLFKKVLFALVSLIAVYTFIPLAFLLVAFAFTLLFVKKQALKDYFLGMLPVSVLVAPLLFYIYGRLSNLDAGVKCPAPGGGEVSLPLGLATVGRSILYFFLPMTGDYYHNLPIYLRALVIILAVVLLLFLGKNRQFLDYKQWTLGFIFVASSLILSVGISISRNYSGRYSNIIFIPCSLSVVSVLYVILKRHRRVVSLYMIAIFASCGFTLFTNYSAMAKPGDFNRVLSYIKQYEKPQQPILAFSPGIATPLAFLYQGPNSIVALPAAERFDGPDNWCKYFLKNEAEILAALSPESRSAPFVWLVTEHPGLASTPEYKDSFKILDDFMRKYYQVESNQTFYGSSVRLLRRKS